MVCMCTRLHAVGQNGAADEEILSGNARLLDGLGEAPLVASEHRCKEVAYQSGGGTQQTLGSEPRPQARACSGYATASA